MDMHDTFLFLRRGAVAAILVTAAWFQMGFTGCTDDTPISLGRHNGCGVTTAGDIECWGRSYHTPSEWTSEDWLQVAAGWDTICGLRTDHTTKCWDAVHKTRRPWGGVESPFEFESISVHNRGACGVRTTPLMGHNLHCWGETGFPTPPGMFQQVSVGHYDVCAVDDQDQLLCWSAWPGNWSGYAQNPPSGTFHQVSVGTMHACGLATAGDIECWGDPDYGRTNAPTGDFLQVAAAFRGSCAIRNDPDFGEVVCWGDDTYGLVSDVPAGQFVEIAAEYQHACGVRPDGQVECWGNDTSGETSPPASDFWDM